MIGYDWAILIFLLFAFLIFKSKSKPSYQVKPKQTNDSSETDSDSLVQMPNYQWPCFQPLESSEIKLTQNQKVRIVRTPSKSQPFSFNFENENQEIIGSEKEDRRVSRYVDQMHDYDASIQHPSSHGFFVRVIVKDMKVEFLNDWERLRRKNEELKHWSFELKNYDISNLDFVIDQYFTLFEELKSFDSDSLFSKSMRSVKMPISKLSFLLEKGKRFEEAIGLIEWYQNYFDFNEISLNERLTIQRRKIRIEEKLAKLNR